MSYKVDLNCDMGESYGRFQIGNDEALMPLISSANIACGFHGGDPLTIEKTITLALQNQVRIGAHPAYPDLLGFGRRYMKVPDKELQAIIKYQVVALKGMVESQGGRVSYVKPHGALYNAMVSDGTLSKIVLKAIQKIDSQLLTMGLAGSETEKAAQEMQVPFMAEAFADRRYNLDGTLKSRQEENSVIHDPSQATKQVLSIILNQKITLEKQEIAIKAQSFCIHGDNPNAVEILKVLHQSFQEKNIQIGS